MTLVEFVKARIRTVVRVESQVRAPRRMAPPGAVADWLGVDMSERICIQPECHLGGKLTRGMCVKHYRYWLDHTPPEQRGIAPRFVDNFWDQVWKSHDWGCWVWQGTTDSKGYGRWKNRHLAHREAWKRERGPIPDGLFALHICDQHACVNPRHLYLGTIQLNSIDASVRGRVARVNADKTHCPSGHPYSGDNLYKIPSGGRSCRECDRTRSREYQRRRREGLRNGTR